MMAVRPTKKEVLAAFRTQEILAAARSLMGVKPFEAVTMDDIAQAAGVAKGTIYLYFPSKNDLMQAILAKTGENLLQELEVILDTDLSPRDKLQQVLSLLVHHLEQEKVLFPIYLQELGTGLEGGGKKRPSWFREVESKIVAHITQLFVAGMAQGQFLPFNPRLLTYLLRGLIQATGFYQMMEGCPNIVQEALPVLCTLILCGLAPRPEVSQEVERR